MLYQLSYASTNSPLNWGKVNKLAQRHSGCKGATSFRHSGISKSYGETTQIIHFFSSRWLLGLSPYQPASDYTLISYAKLPQSADFSRVIGFGSDCGVHYLPPGRWLSGANH